MNEEIQQIIEGIQKTMCPTFSMEDGEFVQRMEGRISDYALGIIIKALLTKD